MVNLESFFDELSKIAGVATEGGKFLLRHGKPIALMGGGAVAYHLGNKELDKYQLGRRVYSQMKAQERGV
jgi:hypothetical protein